jgi:hypothetical protein
MYFFRSSALHSHHTNIKLTTLSIDAETEAIVASPEPPPSRHLFALLLVVTALVVLLSLDFLVYIVLWKFRIKACSGGSPLASPAAAGAGSCSGNSPSSADSLSWSLSSSSPFSSPPSSPLPSESPDCFLNSLCMYFALQISGGQLGSPGVGN